MRVRDTASGGRGGTTLRLLDAPLLAVAVLAPLVAVWVRGQTLAWFDTQQLYAQQRWLVDEALREFRLPLWNPYLGAGLPLLADAIHAVLHPASVLVAWLGTDRGMDHLIGAHVLSAGLGAAFLARELGGSRSAAATAGFVYATSGYVLSMAGNLVFLAGAGSLPLCVAGLLRFAAAPSASSLLLGTLGTAALALSGDAQALIVGGLLSAALAREGAGWRGFARAAAAGGVALLVAGVQLVPSAANVSRSMRAGWDERWAGVWALEPWRLPELVLPGLLRGPDPFVDPLFEALAGPGGWPPGALAAPFAVSVAIGLLPLALAAAGAREGRRGRVLAGLALLLAWVALGPRLGAEGFLARIPLWGSFRYPEKLVGPLTLVIAALAGRGLDALVGRRVSGRWILAVAVSVGAVALVGWRLGTGGLPEPAALLAAERLLRGALHAAASLVALGGWLLLGRRGGAAALAGAVWGAMLAAAPAALRPGDPVARLASPGPAVGDAQGGARIFAPYVYEPLAVGEGRDWSDEAGRAHAGAAHPAYNVRLHLPSLNHYVALEPRRLVRVADAFGHRWPDAARRYAITHVVTDPPVTEPQRVLHEVATAGATLAAATPGGPEIWSVPHREWASFAPRIRNAVGEEEALSLTLRDYAEGGQAVVVESRGRFGVAPGRVLAVERGIESLRIDAEASGEGTLVIADAWWPGWEATLDGARVEIYRADALVRAVRWPPGRHVLEMRYRPPEVRAGLGLSVAGLVMLAGWSALLRRQARAASPATNAAPRSDSAAPTRISGGS